MLRVLRVREAVLREEISALTTKLVYGSKPSEEEEKPLMDVTVDEEEEVSDGPQSSPSLRVRLPWPRAQAAPGKSATFSLDWDFSAVHSQSTLHPVILPGTRTLLGRAVDRDVGAVLQATAFVSERGPASRGNR